MACAVTRKTLLDNHARREAMQTRLCTQLPSLALAVLFTLLVGSVRAGDSILEGTWDVTLKCPKETCDRTECRCQSCPDNTIVNLNTFLKHGGMVWSGGNLRAGTGQGSWEGLGPNHFMALFKFSTFDLASGNRTGSVVQTKDIRLTGDTFTATTTYDVFNAAGDMTAQGCILNETATRFE